MSVAGRMLPVQCLSRSVCCSGGTQLYVFSSCVLLCWPPKTCLMSVKQGTLLISSAVCCFDKMPFTNKCRIQLLFVNTELSVWEEQCKRLREGLWLIPSSWPDSGLVLMCAGFFIHFPCLTLWHRWTRKRWIELTFILFEVAFLPSPSNLTSVSNNLHMRSNLGAQTAAKIPWQGERQHSWLLSFLQRALPQLFRALLTLKTLFFVLLTSMSHLMAVFQKENVLECLCWVAFDSSGLVQQNHEL